MKKTKRDKINLVFSSFLVLGYIICAYFFSSLAKQVGGVWGNVIQALIMIVFGLLLFYATRVGEGEQVKRFSLAVLLLVVAPSLYIVLAGLFGLPFPSFISMSSESGAAGIIFTLACVALGYGIPYTFVSGYELRQEGDEEPEEEEEAEEETVLAGGLAEELAETEAEDEEADNGEEATDENNGEQEEAPAEETEENKEENA